MDNVSLVMAKYHIVNYVAIPGLALNALIISSFYLIITNNANCVLLKLIIVQFVY